MQVTVHQNTPSPLLTKIIKVNKSIDTQKKLAESVTC